VGSDILVASNISRVNNQSKRFLALSQAYPRYAISITGHSLGGTIAFEVGKKFIDRPQLVSVWCFNTGASVASVLRSVSMKLKCKLTGERVCDSIRKKIHFLHIKGDPISFLSKFNLGDHTEQNPTDVNPHTIRNFTDRVGSGLMLTRQQCIDILKKRGVKGYSKLKVAELRNMI